MRATAQRLIVVALCGAALGCSAGGLGTHDHVSPMSDDDLAAAGAPNTCASGQTPTITGTIVVEIGRSTQSHVLRNFGEPARREQGPSEGQERWLYRPAFQSRVDADANTWTFDLLSCEPRPPAWTAVTHQAEFMFDSGGIVAAVNVTRSTLPLDPGG